MEIKTLQTSMPIDEENLDALTMYHNEISKIPPLIKEEERNLILEAKQGNIKARNTLIEHNLRYVEYFAQKLYYPGLDLLELIAEGNLGLIKAIEKYKIETNYRFSTCAKYWIQKQIRYYISQNMQGIKVPLKQDLYIKKWNQTALQLKEELKREPTLDEIAKALSETEKWLSFKSAREIFFYARNPVSYNSEIQEEWELQDTIKDYTSIEKFEEKEMTKEFLLELQNLLTEEEFQLLWMRIVEQKKYEQIGEYFNILKQTAFNRIQSILKKLKNPDVIKRLEIFQLEKGMSQNNYQKKI